MPYKDPEKQREAQRRYEREYRNQISQAQRDRREHKKKFIQDFKKNKPCADCKIKYPPYVMDFDHIRGEKVQNLSRMHRTHSLEAIKKEFAKCEIVCSNCHRHRTWKRFKTGYVA